LMGAMRVLGDPGLRLLWIVPAVVPRGWQGKRPFGIEANWASEM